MQARIERTSGDEQTAANGGGPATLVLENRFTFTDHEAFRHVIEDLGDRPPSDLTIDLSGLIYMDSAAVGMLLLLRERLDRIRIVLKGANTPVRDLIRIARLGTLFDLSE